MRWPSSAPLHFKGVRSTKHLCKWFVRKRRAEKCEDPRELQKLMSEMLIRLQSLESGLAERRKTDKAKHRNRRRCFTCHKLGHISRNCPTSEPRNWEQPRRQGPHRGDSEEENPVKVCGVDHTTLRVRG